MRSAWPLVPLAALLAGACGERREGGPPLLVRVSSTIGLAPLLPPVNDTMTAYLAHLAFVPLSAHFGSLARDGRTVTLVQRPDDRTEAAYLALAIRLRGLASARAGDRLVVLRFDDEAAAALVVLETPCLALGPYVQESFTGDRLVLRRREAGPGPSRIEVLAMPSGEEEWRRFLGREVDIVPRVRPATVQHLRAVKNRRLPAAAAPGRRCSIGFCASGDNSNDGGSPARIRRMSASSAPPVISAPTTSSAVPNGTTPNCTRRSISSPGTPARSKGTISARNRPPLMRGSSRVQKGSSQRVYWLMPARPPTTRNWCTAVDGWAHACAPQNTSAPTSHAARERERCHLPARRPQEDGSRISMDYTLKTCVPEPLAPCGTATIGKPGTAAELKTPRGTRRHRPARSGP